jgi:hypothetical protein
LQMNNIGGPWILREAIHLDSKLRTWPLAQRSNLQL